MKNPTKNLNPFFSALSAKVPDQTNFDERESEKAGFFESDLHGGDGTMMAEIYGSDFQRVWKKTHKKWWA